MLPREPAQREQNEEEASSWETHRSGRWTKLLRERLTLINEAETGEQRNNKEQQDNGARNG